MVSVPLPQPASLEQTSLELVTAERRRVGHRKTGCWFDAESYSSSLWTGGRLEGAAVAPQRS